MKKRFLTIPVLILLATVLSLLAACNKPEKTPEIPDIELDLSAYSVVRPSKASDAVVSAACGVRDLLRGYNKTAPITEDWLAPGTSPDDSAYEILIGTTNRPQSETALSAMTGDGARYVIAVIGNKIVINGSNDDAVIIGTEYFINNIASATSENGVLKLKENFSYTSEPLEMANLISDNKLTYKIVFAKDLDTTFKTSDTKDKTDYIVSKAYAIRDMFEKKLGAKPEVSDDWVAPGTATADLCEILVGTTDRDEYRAFLSELGYDEYGYAVKGNKVVIAGWNDTDIGYACDMFVSQIGSRIKTTTREQNTLTLSAAPRARRRIRKDTPTSRRSRAAAFTVLTTRDTAISNSTTPKRQPTHTAHTSASLRARALKKRRRTPSAATFLRPIPPTRECCTCTLSNTKRQCA